MYKPIKILAFLLVFVYRAGMAQTHEHSSTGPENVSHSIEITGLVAKPVKLSMADIHKMPAVVKNNVKIIGKGGVLKYTLKTVKGVLLKDVLEKAGIDNSNPKESGKMYIVATATDDYKTLFSWNEVFNSASLNAILIVYEEDGMPVKSGGEFIMLAVNDAVTGLRHVKWLKEIAVKKAG